jgi:uncharacterized protein (DUF1501 family)
MSIMVSSDFARTPRINTRGGRDHFLYSAALLAGGGIKGNTVVGETRDVDYHGKAIDHATGKPDEMGAHIRPPDVHATLLKSAGLSYENVSNQSPIVMQTALDS